jgi:hypothetical protein
MVDALPLDANRAALARFRKPDMPSLHHLLP